MNLPNEIAEACRPLFEAIPFDAAMPHLTGSHAHYRDIVEQVLSNPAIAARPELVAGLWLYVDDLDRSHTVSQSLLTTTGSFWHGIMHRREGDFSNSLYWMRQASGHPLIDTLDAAGLVRRVSQAVGDDPTLVIEQRNEWKSLFEWCANQPTPAK